MSDPVDVSAEAVSPADLAEAYRLWPNPHDQRQGLIRYGFLTGCRFAATPPDDSAEKVERFDAYPVGPDDRQHIPRKCVAATDYDAKQSRIAELEHSLATERGKLEAADVENDRLERELVATLALLRDVGQYAEDNLTNCITLTSYPAKNAVAWRIHNMILQHLTAIDAAREGE